MDVIAERRGIWRTPEQCDDDLEVIVTQLYEVAAQSGWVIDPTEPVEAGRTLTADGDPVLLATALIIGEREQ